MIIVGRLAGRGLTQMTNPGSHRGTLQCPETSRAGPGYGAGVAVMA